MKSSQLRFLLTTDHQNKLTEVYDTSFKTVPQIHLHFAKQPKFQHGVKATLFPRTFYVPPPLLPRTQFSTGQNGLLARPYVKPDP
jgi:hypothetical protein